MKDIKIGDVFKLDKIEDGFYKNWSNKTIMIIGDKILQRQYYYPCLIEGNVVECITEHHIKEHGKLINTNLQK